MTRHVLMIEVEGDTALAAAERVAAQLVDATVWGEVEPTAAALLVIETQIPAA